MITKKKRLELGRYGLLHQYGNRAKLLSEKKFLKDIHTLNEHELDELAEELHGTGHFSKESEQLENKIKRMIK